MSQPKTTTKRNVAPHTITLTDGGQSMELKLRNSLISLLYYKAYSLTIRRKINTNCSFM